MTDTTDKVVSALENTLPLLRQYIEEAGPCDHSVNICVCGLIDAAEKVGLAIPIAKEQAEKAAALEWLLKRWPLTDFNASRIFHRDVPPILRKMLENKP